MELLIVIGGLFCMLAIIGFFVSGKPYAFAGHSMVTLAGLAFAVLIGAAVYTLVTSSDTDAPTVQADSFPFHDGDAQYAWYDRHDVAMSDRCYPEMNPPCTPEEWKQAIGKTMTSEEVEKAKWDW